MATEEVEKAGRQPYVDAETRRRSRIKGFLEKVGKYSLGAVAVIGVYLLGKKRADKSQSEKT